ALSFRTALATELTAQLGVLAVLLWAFRGRAELRPAWGGGSLRLMGDLIKYGLTYQVFSVLWTLHLKVDVPLLKAWAGPQAAGLYATAVNLSALITRLPNVLMFVISPYLAQLGGKASLEYSARTCRLAVPFFAAGGLGLALAGRWVLVLLYGASFAQARVPLLVIIPATVAAGLFQLSASHLIVNGIFRPLLLIQAACLAVNL